MEGPNDSSRSACEYPAHNVNGMSNRRPGCFFPMASNDAELSRLTVAIGKHATLSDLSGEQFAQNANDQHQHTATGTTAQHLGNNTHQIH